MMSNNSTPSPVMDAKQASEYLGLSMATLAKWRSAKVNIPYRRLGSRVVYRVEDLDAFIESGRVDVA